MTHGKAVGIMPNPLDTREIVFTNLLLLGFDPAAMEAKEHIPFNRDMFVLPNKKAMEVVMHFLFAKLNPQLTYEEFRDCWPVKNKSQEQQFRKTCFNWLSRLNKEEPDANLPRVVQSLFHSPGGDRFYSFLLLFSLYVLKNVTRHDHGKNVIIPPFPTKTVHSQSFSQVTSKAIQAQTAMGRQRFLDMTQHCLEVQKNWKAYANELTRENRSLKKNIREAERQIHGVASTGTGGQIAKSLARTGYQQEVDAIKRTQQLQKVRSLWGKLEEFYMAHTPQREVINTILNGEANMHKLDATETQVKVPDLLLRECEQEIHLRKIENTYVGGKLNLLSLIQLWNLSLSSMCDKLREDSVPSFEESSAKIRNDIHSHQSYLTNTETLRSTLVNETIPALKKSIEEQKLRLHQTEAGPAAAANYSFSLGLGLAPATPPVSFRAADTPFSERITSFHDSLRRSPTTVSTPDVVNAWSESLRGRRRQEAQPQSRDQTQTEETKHRRSRLPKPVPKETSMSTKWAVPLTTTKKTQVQHTANRQPSRGSVASARRPPTTVQQAHVTATPAARSSDNKSRTEPRKKVTMKTPNQRLGEKTWAAHAVADQIIGVMSVDRPDSASGSSSRNSSRASTPQAHALEDPIAALDDTAFVSHDMIPRTPAPKEKYDPDSDDSDTLQASTNTSQPPPATAPVSRPGRLLETILDQANQELTPSKVKAALFRDSPTGDTGSPLARMIQTTSKWNDSPLSQLSFSSPLPAEVERDYQDERLLSPFTFQTPGKFQTTTPPGSMPGSEDRRNESTVSSLSFQTPEGPNTEPSGTLFTPPRSVNRAMDNQKGPKVDPSGTPYTNNNKMATTNTSVSEPGIGSPLVSFTPYMQKGPRIEPKGTPHAPGSSPLSFTPHSGKEGERDGQSLGSRSVKAGDGLDYLGSALDNMRVTDKTPQYKYNPHTSMSNSASNKSALTPPTHTSSNAPTQETHADNRYSPFISLSEPTVSTNGQLYADEASDAALQASKRSPFGSLDIDDVHHGTVAQNCDHVETNERAQICGENADTLPSEMSRLQTSTKDSPLQSENTSDLMERLNRIKQAQRRHDVTNTTPRQQETGSRPSEERGLGTSSASWDANLESWQAKRLKQIKEAQMSQQVTPGAYTQANLDTSRDSEPALLTPLTSSRGTPENEVGKLTFEPPGTPTGDILSRFSGRSSPSSVLSERFLLQSPFKYNNSENPDSPLRRVFTLDSPTFTTPENHHRIGTDYNSPWKTPRVDSPGTTPSLQGRLGNRDAITAGRRAPSPGTPGLSQYLEYDVPTPVLSSIRRQVIDGANRSLPNGSPFRENTGSPSQTHPMTSTTYDTHPAATAAPAIGTLINFD